MVGVVPVVVPCHKDSVVDFLGVSSSPILLLVTSVVASVFVVKTVCVPLVKPLDIVDV